MQKAEKVYAIYFSPTGNTKRVVESVAGRLADRFNTRVEIIDFTLPIDREGAHEFGKGDLVVVGVPTYAGRVPNKILPYIQSSIKGNRTLAVAIVTYGNRSYDSSLVELAQVLKSNGFRISAGAGLVCPHVFSDKLGSNRPNKDDKALIENFANDVFCKLTGASDHGEISVSELEDAEVKPYYTPLREDGKPAVFLNAKPKTDLSLCDGCGKCSTVCPMGSIDSREYSVVSGVCIKCQACIKNCPNKAKYFDDEDFLSHVQMLESNYKRDAESRFFT